MATGATARRCVTRPVTRRGFTLIEMVVSLTILAVVMTGTYSLVLLASKMVPGRTSPQTCTLEGARTLEQLSADLAYATAVTDLQVSSITFTVPDRTGDGAGESLRYTWSGIAGDSLMYSLNGAAEVPIADDVREFSIGAVMDGSPAPPTYAWSAETLLVSNNPAIIFLAGSISKNTWYGEWFIPQLAADAHRWKITRVRFPACSFGAATGQAVVEIRAAGAGLPVGAALDQAVLVESTLGLLFTWQQFTFAGAPALPISTPACLVINGTTANSVQIEYQALGAAAVNAGLVKTVDGGVSWTAPAGASMVYEVYGQVETAQPAPIPVLVGQATCTLRLGASPSSRVRTLVRVFNTPSL